MSGEAKGMGRTDGRTDGRGREGRREGKGGVAVNACRLTGGGMSSGAPDGTRAYRYQLCDEDIGS